MHRMLYRIKRGRHSVNRVNDSPEGKNRIDQIEAPAVKSGDGQNMYACGISNTCGIEMYLRLVWSRSRVGINTYVKSKWDSNAGGTDANMECV